MMEAGRSLFRRVMSGGQATERARRTKTSPADAIQFSGCKDNQTSADAMEGVFVASYEANVRDKRRVL
jgi:metacaspase-1